MSLVATSSVGELAVDNLRGGESSDENVSQGSGSSDEGACQRAANPLARVC